MKPSPLDDLDFGPATPDPTEAALRSIQDELVDGERLVWFGRPRRSMPATGSPPIGLLGGLAGGSVGLLLLLIGLFDKPHVMPGVAAVGAMLILAGGALVVPRLRAPSGLGSRSTAYALTDRRIILREPVLFGQVRVRSFRPQDFGRISRIERADGSGMILLEGVGRLPNGVQAPVQLASMIGLEGVREVEALIRATLLAD